jgi:3-isopropylmalate dehydratase small subunit
VLRTLGIAAVVAESFNRIFFAAASARACWQIRARVS